jgi:hypothetical protein
VSVVDCGGQIFKLLDCNVRTGGLNTPGIEKVNVEVHGLAPAEILRSLALNLYTPGHQLKILINCAGKAWLETVMVTAIFVKVA